MYEIYQLLINKKTKNLGYEWQYEGRALKATRLPNKTAHEIKIEIQGILKDIWSLDFDDLVCKNLVTVIDKPSVSVTIDRKALVYAIIKKQLTKEIKDFPWENDMGPLGEIVFKTKEIVINQEGTIKELNAERAIYEAKVQDLLKKLFPDLIRVIENQDTVSLEENSDKGYYRVFVTPGFIVEALDQLEAAANKVEARVTPQKNEMKKEVKVEAPKKDEVWMDVVLATDISGSMSEELKTAIEQLEKIAQRVTNEYPNSEVSLKVAVLAYSDYQDQPDWKRVDQKTWLTQSTNACQVKDFCDAKEATEFLRGLKLLKGDDYPECLELALYKMASQIKWREVPEGRENEIRLVRSAYIVSDAPPHAVSPAFVDRYNNHQDLSEKAKRKKGLPLAVELCRDDRFPTVDKLPAQLNLDWQVMLEKLREMGVNINVLTCKHASTTAEISNAVNEMIATTTQGQHFPQAEVKDFCAQVTSGIKSANEIDKKTSLAIANAIARGAKTKDEINNAVANDKELGAELAKLGLDLTKPGTAAATVQFFRARYLRRTRTGQAKVEIPEEAPKEEAVKGETSSLGFVM